MGKISTDPPPEVSQQENQALRCRVQQQVPASTVTIISAGVRGIRSNLPLTYPGSHQHLWHGQDPGCLYMQADWI